MDRYDVEYFWGQENESNRYQPTEKEIILCLRSIVLKYELLRKYKVNEDEFIEMVEASLAKAGLIAEEYI